MPKEISPIRARQGIFSGRVLSVLLTSLTLAVIVGVFLYLAYFPME